MSEMYRDQNFIFDVHFAAILCKGPIMHYHGHNTRTCWNDSIWGDGGTHQGMVMDVYKEAEQRELSHPWGSV